MTNDSPLYNEDDESMSGSQGSKETAGKEEKGPVNPPGLLSEQSDAEETISPKETPKRRPAQLIRSEGRRLLPSSIEHTPQPTIVVRRRVRTDIKSLLRSSTAEQSSFHETDGMHTPTSKTQIVTDLLANFIEYKDQRPPTPSCPRVSFKQKPMSARTSRKSWPMFMSESKALRPSTSPLAKSSRHLGVEKRRSLPLIPVLSPPKRSDPCDNDIPPPSLKKRSLLSESLMGLSPPKRSDACDYDIPPPSLKKRRSLLSIAESLMGSSSQEVGLSRHTWIGDVYVDREKPPTRIDDITRMTMICSSTAVKIFCTACIVARCLTWIGAKRSLFFLITETPTVWMVRFYILVFHVVLIMTEMRIGISGIFPRGSLDNFVHRAFIQSFVGMIEITFNSNKTLVEHVVSGEVPEDEVAKWVELSYAVLRVSPRGLLFCSIIYFTLAVFGKDGTSFNQRKTAKSQTEFEV